MVLSKAVIIIITLLQHICYHEHDAFHKLHACTKEKHAKSIAAGDKSYSFKNIFL